MAMATPFNSIVLISTFLPLNLFFGFQVHAVPYDYSYTLGCVPKPEAAQYMGGIAKNPELNEELIGWTAIGNAKLANAKSPDGNSYAVVSNILTERSDSISQTFNLDKDKYYIVSAWFQASQGEAPVQAKVVTSTDNITAAWITPKSGCWTMLKGGFSVNRTEPADVRFESNITGVDIWVDSISVQPFTQQEWTSHQEESVEKVRKTKVKLEAVDQNGKGVANAAVSFKQLKPNFPWGNVMNLHITNNTAYQKWFLDKGFTYSVFENELKWGYTEVERGVEDYSLPDKMLEFCKANNIKVRGHTILWEDTKFMQPWMQPIKGEELKELALKRANSVINKYKGQFIHWDVINENLHYDVFGHLFSDSVDLFKLLHQLDPHPIPFLNEFNVIESCSIFGKALPWPYLQKINQLRAGGYHGPLGIGLQGHFNYVAPNIPYLRASLDMFASTGLPIWITEFDVDSKKPEQLLYVEPLLRDLFAHPAVNGIIMWGSLHPNMQCYKMCLTDNDYNNMPVGDIVDKFANQFIKVADTKGATDAKGVFEVSLFYGEYEATVTSSGGPPVTQKFDLVANGEVPALHFKLTSSPNPEL